MQKVFGKDIKPASSGLVDDVKDRTDYLFDISLDQAKLKEAERCVNEIIKEARGVRTWNEPSQGGRRM